MFQQSIRRDVKWHHGEHDQEELKRTKVPKTEKIELHCIWVTEVFSPSNIDSLLKSLARLGWDKSPERSRQNLDTWIKQGRSLGNRSSWHNGGIILRRGDTRFFTADKKYAKLPSSIDYAELSLRNITPSLTLVTIQFILRDQSSLSLNKVLSSEDYKTYVRYYPNRLRLKRASYIGVDTQKREAVKTQVDNIHSELYGWFKKYLPGYYSDLDSHKYMPMIDLITSRKYTRTDDKKKERSERYIESLFDYSTEIWQGDNNPELELRLGNDIEYPTATLFGNFEELTKDPGYYSGSGRELITNILGDSLKETIDLLAMHNYLISQEQSLSRIRDRASSEIKSMRKALGDVSYIRNKFLSVSRDAQSIGRDIGISGIAKYIYDKSETIDFKSPYHFRKSHPNLIESLRKQDELRAKELLEAEKHVKEAVLSNGNIASAIANLRIQRNVFWLTVITAVFAFIAISPDISSWWNALTDFIKEKLG